MGFFHTLKQKIRSLVPVSRTYMDNKLRELEKANKQQVKILTELQKNTAQELKDYIANEFSRREDWAKRAVQIQQDAKDRPIWVIKCPAPEGEKKVRWGDYAYEIGRAHV